MPKSGMLMVTLTEAVLRLTRMPRLRWMILALFVGAMILNYLARSVLGVAAPVILAEQSDQHAAI